MFTLYVDDSGTAPDQKVAIAAAVIAPVPAWRRFEREWRRVMQKEGFKCFHTAECVARNGKSEFGDWDEAKRDRVIRRMKQLIKKYAARVIALAIHKADFDEVVTGEVRELAGKSHYTIAVRSLLGDVKRWRTMREHSVQQIEYIFDWMEPNTDGRREEVEGILCKAHLAQRSLESFGIYQGFYAFRKRCAVVQLQAADFVAWTYFQAAKQKYQGTPIHPIAKETLEYFNTLDRDSGDWFDARIWGKENLRRWVKDIQDNGTIERLKELRELLKDDEETDKRPAPRAKAKT